MNAGASHRRSRMTRLEIAESDRLRDAMHRHEIPAEAVAAAAGCSVHHARRWLQRFHDLTPLYQQGIRGAFSRETGGPG